MSYQDWRRVYDHHLHNLYDIFMTDLFKKEMDSMKEVSFNNFCYCIYNQSSKKIDKYDEEIWLERQYRQWGF